MILQLIFILFFTTAAHGMQSNQDQTISFILLSEDIIKNVFGYYCTPKDFSTLMITCKSFNRIDIGIKKEIDPTNTKGPKSQPKVITDPPTKPCTINDYLTFLSVYAHQDKPAIVHRYLSLATDAQKNAITFIMQSHDITNEQICTKMLDLYSGKIVPSEFSQYKDPYTVRLHLINLKAILKNKNELSSLSLSPKELLLHAVAQYDDELFGHVVKTVFQPLQKDEFDWKQFFFDAIELGNLKNMLFLIKEFEIDPNTFINAKGDTALHWAASYEKVEIGKYLIDTYPTLLNKENNESNPPLHNIPQANKFLALLLNNQSADNSIIKLTNLQGFYQLNPKDIMQLLHDPESNVTLEILFKHEIDINAQYEYTELTLLDEAIIRHKGTETEKNSYPEYNEKNLLLVMKIINHKNFKANNLCTLICAIADSSMKCITYINPS